MQTAADAWNRIHAWLSAQAPKIHRSLNPPATDDQFAAAAKAFRAPLPAEYRDLYRVHDGMDTESNLGSLFHGMEFLPLKKVARELDDRNKVVEKTTPVRSADPGINTRDIYNPKWIPFALSGETLLCVDFDPAAAGVAGQVILTDFSDDTVLKLSASLRDFLIEFADDLERRRYFLNSDAKAEGNEFLDCVPEIDVVNWHRLPRWKHHVRRPKR